MGRLGVMGEPVLAGAGDWAGMEVGQIQAKARTGKRKDVRIEAPLRAEQKSELREEKVYT